MKRDDSEELQIVAGGMRVAAFHYTLELGHQELDNAQSPDRPPSIHHPEATANHPINLFHNGHPVSDNPSSARESRISSGRERRFHTSSGDTPDGGAVRTHQAPIRPAAGLPREYCRGQFGLFVLLPYIGPSPGPRKNSFDASSGRLLVDLFYYRWNCLGNHIREKAILFQGCCGDHLFVCHVQHPLLLVGGGIDPCILCLSAHPTLW